MSLAQKESKRIGEQTKQNFGSWKADGYVGLDWADPKKLNPE